MMRGNNKELAISQFLLFHVC